MSDEPKQSETPQERSLIAAIEGNRAGMSHSDLVLTCNMLERGRAAWRKECEEAQRENQRLREHCFANDSDSIVGSCNCGTKTPEIQHHKRGCKYRLIMERDQWQKCAQEQRGLIQSIIDGALHPEIAKRRVMVELQPLRDLVAAFDKPNDELTHSRDNQKI